MTRWKKALASVLCGLLLMAPLTARGETVAEREEFVTGLTLAAVGGAGAVVAAVGSFAYIAETEDTGIWGWMALLAGGVTFAGGVVMAHSQPKGEVGGIISIAGGIFSVALGFIGLSLQTPEEKARNRKLLSWMPIISTETSHSHATIFGLRGVF